MSANPIYLDYAASTPTDPQVLEAMMPYFGREFGNPSSVHAWGQRAEHAIEQARAVVAEDLGCDPEEIVFTSGGSESDGLALRGVAHAMRAERGAAHLLVSPVEHDAVRNTALALAEQDGFALEFLPVDAHGQVDPAQLAARLRPDTALVSVIFGNNEIGTINPIGRLAEVCRAGQVPFHADALQVTSQLLVSADETGVDLMSIGAHKFYGPKGVGALYIRSGTPLRPLQLGGSQEGGQRAGTANVPLIVGMAEAVKLASQRREQDAARFRALRDQLIAGVLDRIPDAQLTGHPSERLSNHASFVFDGVDGNQLLAALDLAGFACSSGSACKTGDPEPSHVLLALGLSERLALGSLRVSVGRHTTQAEIETFLQALPKLVARLRSVEAVAL